MKISSAYYDLCKLQLWPGGRLCGRPPELHVVVCNDFLRNHRMRGPFNVLPCFRLQNFIFKFKAYTQSKPILLAISLHGIKVCDDTGTVSC